MTAASTARSKPRLENLDDLFLLNRDAPLQNGFDPSPLRRIRINDLIPFSNHPFKLYTGERLDDMVESIKKHGILNPIIVRETDDGFQILSGHNRVNAAKVAGLTEITAIVKGNISDEEAWIYVIETNLIQRSFSDMSHSEKAAVIASHHSKLFSQGKRNDILEEVKRLENPYGVKENSTSAEFRRSTGTRESLASEYSLKPNQVALYLRVYQLIDPLKNRLDKSEFALSPAASLSFLKENEQSLLDSCMELNSFTVDMKKADLLRRQSEKGQLDDDSVYLILNGKIGQKSKPNRTPTIKVRKDVYSKYFRPDQSQQEIQGIVEEALELYFSRK